MLSDLLYRLRALFRRGAVEAEMNDELRFHFEHEVNKYEKSGVPREEALRRARLAFGGIEHAKEECREARGVWFVETAIQDLRHGLRRLRRAPGFTAVAVLTLALGIGATTAIFSVVNGVLLKPLPYPHPDELVDVKLTAPGINIADLHLCAPVYFAFRKQSHAFQDIGVYRPGINSAGYLVNVTGLGKPAREPALPVSDGVLPILGVKPLLGRLFTRKDDSPGSPETAILTYGYWRSKFAGDRSVIGRTIDVDGKPHTIIGVLPQSFRFLGKANLAMLLPMQLDPAQALKNWDYGGIARLKPGVTLAQANADVARMLPIVFRTFVRSAAGLKAWARLRVGPNLRPLKREVIGGVGKVLWILMGGIGLVLLIACANVANLLLLRVEGRQQELAIRSALGASRGRIAAELLLESLVLAALGGLLGFGLAYGALQLLVAIAPAGLPRFNDIGIDGTVVLFAFAMSIAASLLFGSTAAFKYAGVGFGVGLREGGRSLSESRERHRSRGVLVIVQVALALVLLVSSGLMIRTFRALTRVNPGFVAPSKVQTFFLYVPDTQVKDPVRVVHIYQEISDKLDAIPGVSSVGISRNLPMEGAHWTDPVLVKGHAYASDEVHPMRRYEFFAPGYLKTLGTRLVAGRDFTWSDIYNEHPVALVSKKFARKYWHNPSNAVGKQIRVGPKGEWREIVGVVADVHQDGLDKEAPTSVYWPILMGQKRGGPPYDIAGVRRKVAFAIRSPRAGSESFTNEVRRAVWAVDSDLPVSELHTLDYYYSKSMARTSFTLIMLALAGVMGLFLSIVGLYGVIAYSVSQRRREIGICIALGAEAEDVSKMVLRGGFKLAALGVGIGILAALGSTRFLASLLYGVKPTDPATFIAVSALLIAVALLASYIPARRAAKVDPMVVLRHE